MTETSEQFDDDLGDKDSEQTAPTRPPQRAAIEPHAHADADERTD